MARKRVKKRQQPTPGPWHDAVAHAYEAVYGKHYQIVKQRMAYFGLTPLQAQRVYNWVKAPVRLFWCPV